MLMATPLGQTVTPQEASDRLSAKAYFPLAAISPALSPSVRQRVTPPIPGAWYPPEVLAAMLYGKRDEVAEQETAVELKARGYYPLPSREQPPISPGIVQIQPVTEFRPPVSPPSDTYPSQQWITDRYPPGYDPTVQPVSPPVLIFREEGPPISPTIYEQFITQSEQPIFRPPYSPPILELEPLLPEIPTSPPPAFVVQEFPEIPPGLEVPYSPPADYYEVPYSPPADYYELPYSPPADFFELPYSPAAELLPEKKPKTVWILIAVLGGLVLLTGDEKKAKRPVEKSVETVENRKEYWP